MKQDQKTGRKSDVLDIVEEAGEALSMKAQERDMKIKIWRAKTAFPKSPRTAPKSNKLYKTWTDNAVKYGLSGTDVTLKVSNCDKIPLSEKL